MKGHAFWVVPMILMVGSPASARQLSPEASQAIRAYVLNDAKADRLLSTLEQLTAYTLSQPDWKKKLAASMKMTFEERVAEMEHDPGTVRILESNKLTAKEYYVSLLALRAGAMSSRGQRGGMAELASADNLAYLKANPGVLARLDRIDAGPKGPGK